MSRVFFRFEAAWDSSLHNSSLLNRITPHGEKVYLTVTAYIEVIHNALHLSILMKNLCFRARFCKIFTLCCVSVTGHEMHVFSVQLSFEIQTSNTNQELCYDSSVCVHNESIAGKQQAKVTRSVIQKTIQIQYVRL